jgi:hypothetical protein
VIFRHIPWYSAIFRDIPPYSVIFRDIPAFRVFTTPLRQVCFQIDGLGGTMLLKPSMNMKQNAGKTKCSAGQTWNTCAKTTKNCSLLCTGKLLFATPRIGKYFLI